MDRAPESPGARPAAERGGSRRTTWAAGCVAAAIAVTAVLTPFTTAPLQILTELARRRTDFER